MAEYYVNLIKATYPSGHILLGGWSLGGLIAIQAAHILSNDPELKVVGIIHDHVTPTCPPTVLIRALDDGSNNSRDLNETSPTETSNDSETQALGFDRYQNFNLRYVVNTPGDHFSIFNKENNYEI
ncbi:hypothetical protein M7I_6485 [Glarea lozoyensis 74030]|uniref:Uncharacterized protein n=1 Tax=Glarea lozoyensis (strain ATCC 74030 / MF5533) TaxID=1104152 RepID=H0EUP7_GLAL7|nr:hypothetical protein M7I_6485 [Glarea lozoyensis 74030]